MSFINFVTLEMDWRLARDKKSHYRKTLHNSRTLPKVIFFSPWTISETISFHIFRLFYFSYYYIFLLPNGFSGIFLINSLFIWHSIQNLILFCEWIFSFAFLCLGVKGFWIMGYLSRQFYGAFIRPVGISWRVKILSMA